jgi:hypothetical protein
MITVSINELGVLTPPVVPILRDAILLIDDESQIACSVVCILHHILFGVSIRGYLVANIVGSAVEMPKWIRSTERIAKSIVRITPQIVGGIHLRQQVVCIIVRPLRLKQSRLAQPMAFKQHVAAVVENQVGAEASGVDDRLRVGVEK